jgi:4-alpha-glucanotransferase
MSPAPLSPALQKLATLSGVVTSYVGIDRTAHEASVETVRAVLGALGTPVDSERDADEWLRQHKEGEARRIIDPVITSRAGAWPRVPVRWPDGAGPGEGTVTLHLESGQTLRQPMERIFAGPRSGSDERGELVLQRAGWAPVDPGYHALSIETPQRSARARLIVAPPCPIPARSWGAFMPLHAARGAEDWGIGTYSDLAELARWVSGLGGGFIGTLPLYPIADRPPVDPSPYLPVSRLAYGDLYIDLTVVPELANAPEARQLLESDKVARRIDDLRAQSLVDYDGVGRLKRQVLEALWRGLVDAPARRDALASFARRHPELAAYADYRARSEPEGISDFHLYVQWLASEQLTAASRAGCPLYADLPVGVRSDGFDAEWAPDAFATGVQGGAPPDDFFTGGQSWGFQPLHPERIRRDGYRYMIECLRRACRHAAYLRIDHVPGLHRLFWIPDGMAATEGVYVTYRSDELRAIVCLEAHRADTVIVGEDLGTVPESVRADMATDRMLRSWVMQFESTEAEPLPDPPPDALATWGTHDLPRFAAYFDGQDLAPDADAEEKRHRDAWRRALLAALGLGSDPALALRKCLEHLAAGPAQLFMVDLEELWGERAPQNRPGTGPEALNWRRRAGRSLAEMQSDTDRIDVLSSLDRLRRDQHDVTMSAAAS